MSEYKKDKMESLGEILRRQRALASAGREVDFPFWNPERGGDEESDAGEGDSVGYTPQAHGDSPVSTSGGTPRRAYNVRGVTDETAKSILQWNQTIFGVNRDHSIVSGKLYEEVVELDRALLEFREGAQDVYSLALEKRLASVSEELADCLIMTIVLLEMKGKSVVLKKQNKSRACVVSIGETRSVMAMIRHTISKVQDLHYLPITVDREVRARGALMELLGYFYSLTIFLGVGVQKIVNAKMAVNRARKWSVGSDGRGKHVEEGVRGTGVDTIINDEVRAGKSGSVVTDDRVAVFGQTLYSGHVVRMTIVAPPEGMPYARNVVVEDPDGGDSLTQSCLLLAKKFYPRMWHGLSEVERHDKITELASVISNYVFGMGAGELP